MQALQLCDLLAGILSAVYNPTLTMINECVVIISPEHHRTLVRGGIDSKAALCEALWHLCNRQINLQLHKTIRLVVPGLAGTVVGAVVGLLGRLINLTGALLVYSLLRHWRSLIKVYSLLTWRNKKFRKFVSPGSLHVVVAGASAGKFSAVCPGFGIGVPPMSTARLSQAVTVAVEPPLPGAAGMPESAEPSADIDGETDGRVLLDPTGELQAPPFWPQERSPMLAEGVALLDISKAGGSVILNRIARLLQVEFPGVRTHCFRKPTFSRPAPAALLREIAMRCRYAIIAMAD